MTRPSIRQLLIKWLTSQSDLAPDLLADDFVFDHPLERMTKSEFIQRLSHSGTWSSITEIAFVHGTDGDAATVEATDDVTGLRHRLAWVVTYKGDKVQRITATSSKIM